MEVQSRTSHKFLLLQVWCGLLTVSMVVMAAFFFSNLPKSAEDVVSTLKPDDIIPTASHLKAGLDPAGRSASYIELVPSMDRNSWQDDERCDSCSLSLRDNAIYCNKTAVYFIYAQVYFSKKDQATSVVLSRNPTANKARRKLVEVPASVGGLVWVTKLVKLKESDSVSLNITGKYRGDNTFWGAFQLH